MAVDRTGWANIGGINYFLDEYAAATGKQMFSLPGGHTLLHLIHERAFLEAFNCCPPLKAIIGKRAKAFNTGKTIFINTNNDKPKTGVPWLKALIRKPNPLQNEKQFFAQQNHYIDIFGYCPVLTIEAAGFEDSGEYSSVWNIPPWLFDITYTKKWLKQFEITGIYQSYKMSWNGEYMELDPKHLHFIFDDGIGTEDDTNLTIPDSRLVGMDYVVSNIVAGYISRNTLITKRGAIGILSNKSKDSGVGVPLPPKAKDDLQKDFAKYGLVGQAYHVIVTDANLQWQQMGYATKDLMLFEENTENIERLCDAYGWPIELIARGKDVTYDNKIQARKDLYQNTLMPESDSRMEQFSRALKLDNIDIKKDYSEVPVLQTDLKTKADARNAVNEYCKKEYDAGLMTKNEWLEELGRPPVDRPEFDLYNFEQETTNDNQDQEDPLNEDELAAIDDQLTSEDTSAED